MDKWYIINRYDPINNYCYVTETTEEEIKNNLITNYIHWNYYSGYTININLKGMKII
jgi:hypothetical protein